MDEKFRNHHYRASINSNFFLCGDDYVNSLLYYLYERGKVSDKDQFHELITSKPPPDLGEKNMTLAELYTQKGVKQGSRAIARNLLEEGLDPALVAKTTKLDIPTIKAIIAELLSEKV